MSKQDNGSDQVSAERLARDFKVLVADAEALLRATAGEISENVGERAKEARTRLKTSLDEAKATWESLESKTVARVQATDRALRENPYPSLGIALGVGFLLGILVGRR